MYKQLYCTTNFKFCDTRNIKWSSLENIIIQRTHIKLFVENPPYRDGGQTADPSGEVIKMQHIESYGCYTLFQKYIAISANPYASSGPKAEGVL